jgi:hypothetical protein
MKIIEKLAFDIIKYGFVARCCTFRRNNIFHWGFKGFIQS